MTTETFGGHGRARMTPDTIVVLAISGLATVLVLAGLLYALGTGGRHQAALAAAGCEPNLSPPGLQCTTAQMLVSQYDTITVPAVQQLNTDVSAYTASQRHHLRAARAALSAEITLENALGASLARFPFPPAVAPEAARLIEANQARARLTAQAARSASLARLRSFSNQLTAASVTVEAQLQLTRRALQARPAAGQEP
jgi:hypothetical protein